MLVFGVNVNYDSVGAGVPRTCTAVSCRIVGMNEATVKKIDYSVWQRRVARCIGVHA
jgi:hypothetical protein